MTTETKLAWHRMPCDRCGQDFQFSRATPRSINELAICEPCEIYMRAEKAANPYPTLHTIGLGTQLDALERICAQSLAGKHAGESILTPGADYHFSKADSHMIRSEAVLGTRDADSGERHLVHAAARLLMAAACVDAEDEHGC